MSDFLVFAAIVFWIIISAVKAMRDAKNALSSGVPTATIRPTGPPRARPASMSSQPPSGYAGRNQQRNPEQSRAMQSAAPRLAEGAENSAIVADREADRLAEERYTRQVSELIRSEPTARGTQYGTMSAELQPVMSSFLLGQLGQIPTAKQTLINGIILAEVLGPPRCKSGKGRH